MRLWFGWSIIIVGALTSLVMRREYEVRVCLTVGLVSVLFGALIQMWGYFEDYHERRNSDRE